MKRRGEAGQNGTPAVGVLSYAVTLPLDPPMRSSRPLPLVVAVVLVAFCTLPAGAQQLMPRFGLSFQSLLSFQDGLGIGFHGRAAAPVNADLSVAVDLGAAGFVLEGRRNATYVVTPQLTAILNLPAYRNNATYVGAGFGYYAPVNRDDNTSGGPTFHVAYGWIMGLRETSLFIEIDPALVVAEDGVGLSIPIRVGAIF
jgi:hypothetical protein